MIFIYFILPIIFLLLSEAVLCRDRFSPRALLSKRFLGTAILSLVFVYIATALTFMSFTAILESTPITLLVVAASSLVFSLLRIILRLREKREALALLLFALTLALFLEGFIFNMRHYKTCEYEPFVPENVNITGVEPLGDGKYKLNGTSATLEITDINEKVYDIYLPLNLSGTATVTVHMTDESNAIYKSLPTRTITGEVDETKYLHLLTNGASEKIKLVITPSAKNFSLGNVVLNERVNFDFSALRFFVTALVIFLLALLRPGAPIYKKKLSFSSEQCTAIAVIMVLEIILLIILTTLNPAFYGHPGPHTRQYQQLAESFLDGKLYLAEEPPAFLAEMENPYDYELRRQMASKAGESYYWDAAYFDGHYYVYFGVLPVLVFYLPFKALTGADMPNLAVVEILLALFAMASFLFLSRLVKKYFKAERIPFVSFISIWLILVNASGAVFIAKRPDFYSIPILSALVLTMLGLYFWMRSTEKADRINTLHIGLGSLCMALVAACRPQFLLVSALAFVIFWDSVFASRTLLSKKGLGATISFALPYVAVAAALMWYNFARFGSPFDFGQNYNLTTNDMTGRGIVFERSGLALFTYFFQPPRFTALFPFIKSVTLETSYLGTTITEAMFGGIFATIPLLWVLFLIPSMKNDLKEKKLLPFVLTVSCLSFVIGILDAQGAGLLQRYVSDFAYLAIIAAILIIFTVYERKSDELAALTNGFVSFSFFASGLYCALIVFAVYGTEIYYKNPSLFARAAELVEFWK